MNQLYPQFPDDLWDAHVFLIEMLEEMGYVEKHQLFPNDLTEAQINDLLFTRFYNMFEERSSCSSSSASTYDSDEYSYESDYYSCYIEVSYNGTLLDLASLQGHIDVVDALLEVCPQDLKEKLLLIRNNMGLIPLHYTPLHPNGGAIATLLLKHSPIKQLRALAPRKLSTLHLACAKGNMGVVTVLLSHCPDEQIKESLLLYKNADSLTAYQLAFRANHHDVAALILKHSSDKVKKILQPMFSLWRNLSNDLQRLVLRHLTAKDTGSLERTAKYENYLVKAYWTTRIQAECGRAYLSKEVHPRQLFHEVQPFIQASTNKLYELRKLSKAQRLSRKPTLVTEYINMTKGFITSKTPAADIFFKAYMAAYLEGFDSKEMIAAIVDITDYQKMTAMFGHEVEINFGASSVLHVAARYGHTITATQVLSAQFTERDKTIRLLIQRDEHDDTALHTAITCGHPKVVGILLRACPKTFKPALIQAGDDSHATPLHRVAQKGSPTSTELLLGHCPDAPTKKALLLKQDVNQHTAFQLAIQNGFLKTAKLIFAASPDEDTKVKLIVTVKFQTVPAQHLTKVLHMLFELPHAHIVTVLHNLFRSHHPEICTQLLNHCANETRTQLLLATDLNINNALHLACALGDPSSIATVLAPPTSATLAYTLLLGKNTQNNTPLDLLPPQNLKETINVLIHCLQVDALLVLNKLGKAVPLLSQHVLFQKILIPWLINNYNQPLQPMTELTQHRIALFKQYRTQIRKTLIQATKADPQTMVPVLETIKQEGTWLNSIYSSNSSRSHNLFGKPRSTTNSDYKLLLVELDKHQPKPHKPAHQLL